MFVSRQWVVAAIAICCQWVPLVAMANQPPSESTVGVATENGATNHPSNISRGVLVVCPDVFRTTLQPWIQRREAEGLKVHVIPSRPTYPQLHADLVSAYLELPSARYVMLVGDCPLSSDGRAVDPTRQIPTGYPSTDVTRLYQSTPELASDFSFGDFDDDGIADAAVGRLPVQNQRQLQDLITRIFLYEDSVDVGDWRNRIQLVAGVGGFGFLADTAIETVTRSLVTTAVPAQNNVSITYAGPDSPFCPPGSFHQRVMQDYAAGCRFWVYAGHGAVDQLDRVNDSGDGIMRSVMTNQDAQRLESKAGCFPIAFLVACYTGAFDARTDCLAERMLRSPGGPIAVLCGSRVTMPYGNACIMLGLISSIFHPDPNQRAKRLGDAWLAASAQTRQETIENPAIKTQQIGRAHV